MVESFIDNILTFLEEENQVVFYSLLLIFFVGLGYYLSSRVHKDTIESLKTQVQLNMTGEKVGKFNEEPIKIRLNTLYEVTEIISKPCFEMSMPEKIKFKGSFLKDCKNSINEMPNITKKPLESFTMFEHRIPKFIYLECSDKSVVYINVIGIKVNEV